MKAVYILLMCSQKDKKQILDDVAKNKSYNIRVLFENIRGELKKRKEQMPILLGDDYSYCKEIELLESEFFLVLVIK